VTSFNTRLGAVTLTLADVTGAGGAPLASPNFTGSPTAPTVAPNTNSAQIATTAFVLGQASSTPPAMNGAAAVGAAATYARADHVHPTDTSLAPLASPALTGTPTAPTAAPSTNNTQLATTAFVETAIAGVPSVGITNNGRNLLHNSMFNIQQRGGGPWSAIGYMVDRWRMDFSLDVMSTYIAPWGTAGIPGDEEAAYALEFIVTGNAGAGAFSLLRQPVERVKRLSGKTITISFVANVLSGTAKIGVGAQQYFGTGGSPSAKVDIPAVPVTLTTTQTRYSVTLNIPSIAGKSLGSNDDNYTDCKFFFSSGATNNTIAGSIGVQSASFIIWGIQLEIGSVATPLEKIDPQQDIAKCQRFFQKGQLIASGYGSGAAGIYYSSNLPVTMRALPTIVPTVQSSTNLGPPTSGSYTGNEIWFNATITATGQYTISTSYTASADF
jgi:hypothetical protein